MREHDLSFVRTEMVANQTPPPGERGIIRWMRMNLFATVGASVLTIVGLLIVIWVLPPFISWLFVNAEWSGTDRSVLRDSGAGRHPARRLVWRLLGLC